MLALKPLLYTAGSVLLLDLLYTTIIQNTFERMIINVQKTSMQVRLWSAVLCYILLILGLWYFIIRTKRSEWDAFCLGIFVYGIYELTNYSLIKNWSPLVAAIDTIWGGLLFTISTHIVYLLDKKGAFI